MTRILGISDSLRRGSYNSALLKTAVPLMDVGVELEIAFLYGIPLYDGDLEASDGIPQAVRDLKAKVTAYDGLLLATPEYNNGIPGVFKNAIDWLSRPPGDIAKVFGDRPVALIGATPGGFGTVLAQVNGYPRCAHSARARGSAGGCSCRGRSTSSTKPARWWTKPYAHRCATSYVDSSASFRPAPRRAAN